MSLERTATHPLRSPFRAIGSALCVILWLFGSGAVAAQGEPAAEAAVATADAQRLLETLKDDDRRKALIADLEALIELQQSRDAVPETSGGARLLEALSTKVDAIAVGFASLVGKLGDLPAAVTQAGAYFADGPTRNGWLVNAAKIALILLAGLAAHWLAKRLLRRFHSSIEARGVDTLWLTLVLVVLRAFLDLVAIAVLAAAAYAAMTVLAPAHGGKVIALALINASVVAQSVLVIAKMILAPDVSTLRLIALRDETANYLLIWVRRLTYVIAYGYFLIGALGVLGASALVHGAIARLLGLIVTLMLVVLILQNRQDVAARIRGDSTRVLGQVRRRAADVWHLVAMLYVIVLYGVWVLDISGGFDFVLRATLLSVVAMLFAAALLAVLRRVLGKAFALSEQQKARFPGLEARASRYLPILMVGLKLVIYGTAALTVLNIWGLDTLGWLSTPLGSSIIKGLVNIIVVVIVSLLAWEVISAAIERYLTKSDSEGNTIDRGQRAMTLLPLLRNVVMVVLAVLVTLTALSEIGVNIGPLIAGAGILGLAIGFGAQTFVKDVITGFFILVENAVAVGDIVILGGYAGKVEAISIRSIQLRDLKGNVHRIPFSEVTSTTNRSKVYSFAAFDIGVAYREDVDHCMNVIREVGAELRRDEDLNALVLEDIEIMGVQSFDDSAVIIRARIKVQPGKQLGVERAFNRLLKNRFDAEGIEIPFPHRTIYFGVDSQGRAPPAHVQIGEPSPSSRRPKATLSKPPEGERADFDEPPTPKPDG